MTENNECNHPTTYKQEKFISGGYWEIWYCCSCNKEVDRYWVDDKPENM